MTGNLSGEDQETGAVSLSKLHRVTFSHLLQKPSNSVPFRMTSPSVSTTISPTQTGSDNKRESLAPVTVKTNVVLRHSSIRDPVQFL